jgi:phosphate/phosphite/phosphonate ABC transporter binding protein
LGCEIVRDELSDYTMLADRMSRGVLDFAWLPPIVYLRLGDELASPLLATRRGTRGTGYETALIVRDDSLLREVADLRGARVAWVDRWSAAGYVIPRLRLQLGGLDPARLFRMETFYGTHSAAVRAVLEGDADVAGTYATTNARGDVIDGAWKEMARDAKMRVLMTFGEIPPDIIAVRPSLSPATRGKLRAALEEAATSRAMRPIVKGIFGAEGFGPFEPEAYAGLRAALSIHEKE